MMHALVRWIGGRCLRWYYRERCFVGLERIPRDGPVLLIGNHGNDLPDVVCGFLVTPRPLRYVATISGATSAIAQAAYRGLGVIPVMRVRDARSMREMGHDGAAMNKDAFRLVAEALGSGDMVGAFPEGGVHDGSSLGAFRAGVAQMVLNSIDGDGKHDVQMIAFGIQYDSPRRWRSDVTVVVGEPMSLRQWAAQHATSLTAHAPEVRARSTKALPLRDRMYTALRAVTRNSPSWESAAVRDRLAAAVAGVLGGRTDDVRQIATQVQLACSAIAREATPSPVHEPAEQISRAVERAGGMAVAPRDVARVLGAAGVRGGRPAWPSLLGVVATTPLAAVGWLVHGPAFMAIARSARRSARDRAEYVARAFVPGLYLILSAYAMAGVLLATLLMLTSRSSWWAIVFVMLLPRLGDVALWWLDAMQAIRLRMRVARWPASERTALCLAADALRVAWHSHLASTVVHSAADPVVPESANLARAAATHPNARADAQVATNPSTDSRASS